MAPRHFQGGPRCTHDGARWAQEAPKRPPKCPNRSPRAPPGRPEEANLIDCPSVFDGFTHLRIVGLPTAQDGPRGRQGCPKIAQEASNRASRKARKGQHYLFPMSF
eukprot:1830252-Pyramimonas_sp.AAC.1